MHRHVTTYWRRELIVSSVGAIKLFTVNENSAAVVYTKMRLDWVSLLLIDLSRTEFGVASSKVKVKVKTRGIGVLFSLCLRVIQTDYDAEERGVDTEQLVWEDDGDETGQQSCRDGRHVVDDQWICPRTIS